MKQLVYINAYAAKNLSNNKIKSYVTEKLNGSSWYDFSPLVHSKQVDEEFTRGLTSQQLSVIRQTPSGNFVNPYLLGLQQDYKYWLSLISTDQDSFFTYLEVPYEKYVEATQRDEVQVDRETYDLHSLHVQTLVQALNQDIRKNISIH